MTFNLFGREISISKPILIVAIAAVVIFAGAIGYILTNSGRDIIIESNGSQEVEKSNVQKSSPSAKVDKEEAKSDLKEEEDEVSEGKNGIDGEEIFTETEEDMIKVYVVGCVKKPGVFSLKKGQLIDDAVRLAGGLTADADPASINMVYELKENVMLDIQSKKDIGKTENLANSSNSSVKPIENNMSGGAGKGVRMAADSGSAKITGQQAETSPSAGEAGKGKINLNTATAVELDTLPGIGEATAADIISFREANGPFQKISDIMKVPRIKESRYTAIKDLITVN